MIEIVKRTGHSSYYVEKGMAAMGKIAAQMDVKADHLCGGGTCIWLYASRVGSQLELLPASVSDMARGTASHFDCKPSNHLNVALMHSECPVLPDCNSCLLFRFQPG